MPRPSTADRQLCLSRGERNSQRPGVTSTSPRWETSLHPKLAAAQWRSRVCHRRQPTSAGVHTLGNGETIRSWSTTSEARRRGCCSASSTGRLPNSPTSWMQPTNATAARGPVAPTARIRGRTRSDESYTKPATSSTAFIVVSQTLGRSAELQERSRLPRNARTALVVPQTSETPSAASHFAILMASRPAGDSSTPAYAWSTAAAAATARRVHRSARWRASTTRWTRLRTRLPNG